MLDVWEAQSSHIPLGCSEAIAPPYIFYIQLLKFHQKREYFERNYTSILGELKYLWYWGLPSINMVYSSIYLNLFNVLNKFL